MHSGHQRSLLEFRSEFRSRFDDLKERLLALAETWGPCAPFRELAPAVALQLVSNSEQVLAIPQRRIIHAGESTEKTLQVRTRARPGLHEFQNLLGPYGDDGKANLSLDSALGGQMIIPGEVVTDIQRWITSPGSSLLWVEGPAFGEVSNALSSIGVRISDGAKGLDLPCIAFFAKMRYSPQKTGVSRQDAGFTSIAMLYSLISQLARVVPPTFDEESGLTEQDLEKMDGTPNSIPQALKIFESLLSAEFRGLICVISGFDLIDCREHAEPLTKMIQCLQSQPAEKRVKSLFITQGNCRSLSKTMTLKER